MARSPSFLAAGVLCRSSCMTLSPRGISFLDFRNKRAADMLDPLALAGQAWPQMEGAYLEYHGPRSGPQPPGGAMVDQAFATHRKYVPGYHFVTLGILTVNFLWSVYRAIWPFDPATPIFDRLLTVLVAIALALLAWYLRVFPLRAQDRVIRLEERHRLERLLAEDLRRRIW